MIYDVVIVGGGLAGCGAAIHLAQAGWSVRLIEKDRYPAHKLCGEFLSPEVRTAFDRLGVTEAVMAAGPHSIEHVSVTGPRGPSFAADLPGTALGLSRYTLDPILLRAAEAAGVQVADATLVHDVSGGLEQGFTVATATGTVRARVVVGAYGKRGRVDRSLQRAFLARTTPFVAFKTHFDGVAVPAAVELHAFPGGYCGLSHIEGGRANACWIGRVRDLKAAGGRPEAMLAWARQHNPALDARLAAGRRVTPFQSASQLTFRPRTHFDGDVCMVGDTAGMIAPLCGDGMAMALRSAELAAPRIDAFLDGRVPAEALRQDYERVWRREFGMRLRLGRWLQQAAAHPALVAGALGAVRLVPGLGQWLIRNTRG